MRRAIFVAASRAVSHRALRPAQHPIGFGPRLVRIRRSRGLTQEELVALVGLSNRMVDALLEHRRAAPTSRDLVPGIGIEFGAPVFVTDDPGFVPAGLVPQLSASVRSFYRCQRRHQTELIPVPPVTVVASLSSLTILACVASTARARLLSALPGATLHSDLGSIEHAVRANDECLVFVDPQTIPDGGDTILRWRDRYPRLSIVLYMALEPESMQLAVRLTRAGISDVILRNFDDTPERMRGLVEDFDEVAARQLTPIEPALARLPSMLSRAVRDLFRRPRAFRCTLDLAAAAGISARATFRHLKTAGFVSPRRLVASARAIRAYHLLRGGSRSAQEVATRLGYRSVDQLSMHLTQLARCTATDIKRGQVPEDFVNGVLRSLIATTALPRHRPSREEYAFVD